MGLVVFVGVLLESTVATEVSVSDSSAIDELLLSEGEEGAGSLEVSGLEGADS